jgi:HAE1 family hydrophobic/amphiphilic exporter-1
MGTLPTALGFAPVAESPRPLRLALVGRLLVSQLITLYITPVYYIYLESFQDLVRSAFHRRPRPVNGAEIPSESIFHERRQEVPSGE